MQTRPLHQWRAIVLVNKRFDPKGEGQKGEGHTGSNWERIKSLLMTLQLVGITNQWVRAKLVRGTSYIALQRTLARALDLPLLHVPE